MWRLQSSIRILYIPTSTLPPVEYDMSNHHMYLLQKNLAAIEYINFGGETKPTHRRLMYYVSK